MTTTLLKRLMLNEVIFAHDFRQRKACLQAATRYLKFKIQKNVHFNQFLAVKLFHLLYVYLKEQLPVSKKNSTIISDNLQIISFP